MLVHRAGLHDRGVRDYLLSTRAAVDAANLICKYDSERYTLSCDWTSQFGHWTADARGLWQRVRYADERMNRTLAAYIKREAGLVCDNGEALVQLRLKTGLASPISSSTVPLQLLESTGVLLLDGLLRIDEVESVRLGDAVARLVLAAHWVSCLEVEL